MHPGVVWSGGLVPWPRDKDELCQEGEKVVFITATKILSRLHECPKNTPVIIISVSNRVKIAAFAKENCAKGAKNWRRAQQRMALPSL